MATTLPPTDDRAFVERALHAAIRIGLVLLLVAWCFTIVRPFVVPVMWGIIIAVATYRGFAQMQAWLGGRGGIPCGVPGLGACTVGKRSSRKRRWQELSLCSAATWTFGGPILFRFCHQLPTKV